MIKIEKIIADQTIKIETESSKSVTVETLNGRDGYTPIKGIDYFDGQNGTNGTNGVDGYTPVKGVDYFDGKDGKDGINGKDGVNGKDGKDGYTPIKGVDYFDGQPGSPGQKGADGYTPIKNVDYFDGKDGKDGTDYVITESDYNTIAEVTKTKITVPTKTSQLTNDSGFITNSYHDSSKQDTISDLETIRSGAALGTTSIQEHQDISGKQDKITSSNKLNYNLISNTPTIPTVTNDFTNDYKNKVDTLYADYLSASEVVG